MKRVFHIISHFDVGGAERVALNIAKSRNAEIEYHIVEVVRANTPFTASFVSELQAMGVSYHRAYVPQISFHYVFERLAAMTFPLWFIFLFRKYRPQVIHCHTDIPDLAVYCFFKLFPRLLKDCTIVRTIHNTVLWVGMKRWGARVENFMQAQRANVAISSSVQQSYQQAYGEQPPIIHNGIAPVAEQKTYDRLRPGKVNILFAGRFEEQKGICHLIEIARRLKNDTRYFFHAVGDGRLKDDLIKGIGHLDNAEVRPPVFGLSAYLHGFDYLLMPSEHEGLALLPIEAGFAGVPTIINNCPGLKDTLPDDWPLKVEQNDMEGYMHLFCEVIPHADREELGRKARDFSSTHFSLEGMQQAYERLYLSAPHC